MQAAGRQPGFLIGGVPGNFNVTARLGTAFVKKFTEERELTVVLVVDVSASGNFGSVSQSKRELELLDQRPVRVCGIGEIFTQPAHRTGGRPGSGGVDTT